MAARALTCLLANGGMSASFYTLFRMIATTDQCAIVL